MKKLLFPLLLVIALAANAQQNPLLDQAFWRNNPNVDAVKAEIAKGNDPFQSNASAFNPVVMAINGNAPLDVVKYMLELPKADINAITHDSRSYLHWAAMRGNVELIEYLLSKKAKTDFLDNRGNTPFLALASGGQQNTKVYELFTASGLDIKKEVNQDGANALLLAIANDKEFKLIDYFVSKGLSLKSVDAAGNNAFAYVASTGDIEKLKTVLAKGVPVSQQAMLMVAQGGGARRGPAPAGGAVPAVSPLAIYEYLESVGVKPTTTSKTGQNLLHYLVRRAGGNDLVKYIIGKGVNVNAADEDGITPLMAAASGNNDTTMLALLLPQIKNIDQANAKGQTALSLAVQSNSLPVINYLIGKGADVKVLDKKGNNLVYYAFEGYRGGGGRGGFGGPGAPGAAAPTADLDAKFELLRSKGLNITAPQQDGNTLYHLAVAKNNQALVQHFQSLNIDINAKNKEGITALHKAAMIAKDTTMMNYLVSIGAKKDAKTGFEETAYDLAAANETLTKNKVSITFLK